MTNKRLDEISFLRPILILLLVFYHTFIIYAGGWHEPEGFVPCKIYSLLDSLSYSFMLPTFVFISGYIWGWQGTYRSVKENFKSLVIKKTKRLILPSIFFSIAYLLLFSDFYNEFVNNISSLFVNGNIGGGEISDIQISRNFKRSWSYVVFANAILVFRNHLGAIRTKG